MLEMLQAFIELEKEKRNDIEKKANEILKELIGVLICVATTKDR